MFLKRIEIKGFKSFADRVEIDLQKGITGVVGPNGSGKSNISDAIRWVLGEQSAKSLRGGKMEDVIFAGTDIRKPLGYAEVSITIDNTDNKIPVEYTEITATRRMYRSGESEYYINKTACRLKDIIELFMDTGVSREGYSIIGQGRVDEIINAKPEERREIFEEAAGIVKYKTRKQESEKKLDNTEQNITRVNDIINELENQLEPLRDQSETAKKYLSMRDRLKSLELNIFIRNMERLNARLSGLNENYSKLEEELLLNNRGNARIEEDYEKVKAKLAELDESIDELQQGIYSSNNEIEKDMGEINVLNEKTLNIDNNVGRLNEEIMRQKQQIEKFNAVLEENRSGIKGFASEMDVKVKDLELKEAEFDRINSSISEKEKYIEDLKTEVIEIMNLIADKKSSINGYRTFKAGIEKRRRQIDSEKADKENRLSGLKESLKGIEKDISEQDIKYEKLKENIDSLERDRKYASDNKRLAEKTVFELNNKIQSKQGLYRALSSMESEFEGYARSVKEIMRARNTDSVISKGVCGVVADIIKVKEKYETAIEIALGGALQNVVTEDEYSAKHCIEFLKEHKYGRATFLPLTTISGRSSSYSEKSLSNIKGFIGFAKDLVEYDSRYSNIISSLLGRVIAADNLDNAIVIAKHISYSMKIVTLDGEVINAGGSFTGGSISENGGRILSRKREIEELEKELKELKVSLAGAERKRLEADKSIMDMENSIKIAGEQRHDMEKKISSLRLNMDSINKDMDRVQLELENLDKEIIEIENEYNESDKKIDEETNELKNLEERSTKLSNTAEAEQSSIKDIWAVKEEMSSAITAIKVSIAEYRQKISQLEEKNNEVNESISESIRQIEDREKTIYGINGDKEKLLSEVSKIRIRVDSQTKKNSEIKERLEKLNIERKKSSMMLDEMGQKKKDYSDASQNIQSEIHKMEMQKARLDMEIENAQSRVWDEYEVSYADAMQYKTDIDSITGASKEAESIKNEIKELGSVNVSSIDEYVKVKDRYEFLIKQRDDLEQAKESLEKVIAEMTERMKTQFIKNFAIIKENFNAIFKHLFGGGRAELVLCDMENILTSGVDIIAEPPGKKHQNLTMLSGGEKSLTAIALLFAILTMKPSPFCILDEIEAALDDANVARFGNYLRELSGETQFIVVTHRKGTMEVADSLYGVTMEEKGVSKVVSVKLTEKAS